MKIRHKREQVFLDTIADKNKTYTYQPRWFYFADGSKYMPDFYCKEDDTYIEIVGTRQAYHQNRHKYLKMESEYPHTKFQVVKSKPKRKIPVGVYPDSIYQIKVAFQNVDRKHLAEDLGSSYNTIEQIANGLKPVSPQRAIKIELITKGAVRKSVLRPDIFT